MTLKTLVTGVAAAAVVGGAALGVTSIASGASSAAPAVQPVVFDIPLPHTPCAVRRSDQIHGMSSTASPHSGGSFSGARRLVEGGVGRIEGMTADRAEERRAEGYLPVAFDFGPIDSERHLRHGDGQATRRRRTAARP